MRHGNKQNNLGRTKSHRAALLKNMSSSLILHKRINTTLAKAKALRRYLEPLITKSKTNTTHSRRVVFSYLQNKITVDMLFSEISEKIASRPGGYLRIIKLGQRSHDAAEMAMIEFVDYNTVYNPNEASDAKKKTRRSRAGRKATEEKEVTSTPIATDTVINENQSVVAVEATEEVTDFVESNSSDESNDINSTDEDSNENKA